jgi:MFS family permease
VDIAKELNLPLDFLAHLTSAIQFGFICGTLVFAVFTISDRFSASKVFFASAMVAGLFNLMISIPGIGKETLLFFRFVTGFFLAGIYPVGMKIAADYFREGLGKSLGFLVGALVMGKAFPHFLNSVSGEYPWRYVVFTTSALCFIGGISIVLLVPNGPYRKWHQQINFKAFLDGFKLPRFRAVAFGYFGHMWELYSFWVFVPVMLAAYNYRYPEAGLNVAFLSFIIIGFGSVACMVSGLLSQKIAPQKLATLALFLSCCCCLVSPLFLFHENALVLIGFLIFWGVVVIADSPLFSTLVAHNAPPDSKGTSLTIVTCIGFAITIISIQFVNAISVNFDSHYVYMFLAIGPVLGLIALLKNNNNKVNGKWQDEK